jgi:mannose-6-phosphate isomerase-like protein (cupin superfamily)
MIDKLPPGYSPSPRPSYDVPTLVRRSDVKRHIWGDRESGLVADWLYASTNQLHVLLFGLAPGKWFRHSPSFRTVFGADEVLYVLSGAMLASNPQSGEVVECEAGESVFFRKGTWHHVRAQGSEPLRVLEFFAPPPSQGTSGAYAATQPYVDKPSYRRDALVGTLAEAAPPGGTLRVISSRERSLRLEGEIAVGLIASTEQLTVAELQVPSGAQGERTAHGGDAMIFGLEGELMIRSQWQGASNTFEIGPHDAVFIPQRGEYEVLSFSHAARALLGVAPTYLAP